MKLILTDVDGTLTRKSLVLSHAGYLIEKGIIKDDGSYKAWSSDLKNESLIMAVAQNYRKEIIGLTLADMDAKNFVRGFYKNQNNWYSTLDEIEQRILVGDKVVLITGSSVWWNHLHGDRFFYPVWNYLAHVRGTHVYGNLF